MTMLKTWNHHSPCQDSKMDALLSLPAVSWTAAINGLVALFACLVALWGVSLRRRDVSVVDAFWGPGFLLLGLVQAASVGEVGARGLLVLSLVALWGVRLGLHLHRRSRGQPEDRRYAAMRARRGPSFGWQSLYIVFLLQGALLFVISAPLQVVLMAPPSELGLLDLLGASVSFGGIAIEASADAQLARFRRRPQNERGVLRQGLFRYSRHPNYFGDCCVFWGLWVVSLSVPGGFLSCVGPALLTLLLLRVSGVVLLEADIAQRRPEYRQYVETTSAFFPRPPKASRPPS